MGFLDKLKKKADDLGLAEKTEQFTDEVKKAATQAKEKAGEVAEHNRDRVESAMDKAGAKINEKTDGKYADTVDKAKAQVNKGVTKVAEAAPQSQDPETDAKGGAGGAWSPFAGGVSEEELAEEARAADADPEAPLDDVPPRAALFDANGEPVEDGADDEADEPGTEDSSSGSW